MELSNSLRRWQAASAVLAALGLADSLYLWTAKMGAPLVCGVGECDVVNSSPYSEVLGVPVAFVGMLGYAALLALALWSFTAREDAPYWLVDLRLFLAGVGVLFSAFLTSIELFVLHAI